MAQPGPASRQPLGSLAQVSKRFSKYIATQPVNVQRLLGNLQTTEVDVDYWISAINAGTATIATNGSVADRNRIRSHLAADYDIYSAITKLQTEGPKVIVAWVKAHQDSMTSIAKLPLDAHLNVQADTDVTTFWKNPPIHLTPSSKP
eukprot:9087203-Ditylum_brightwellii.AAC.1